MDALVKAALDRVNETVNEVGKPWTSGYSDKPLPQSGADMEKAIARAIYAVDALKSALKTVKPEGSNYVSIATQVLDNPEDRAKYVEMTTPRK